MLRASRLISCQELTAQTALGADAHGVFSRNRRAQPVFLCHLSYSWSRLLMMEPVTSTTNMFSFWITIIKPGMNQVIRRRLLRRSLRLSTKQTHPCVSFWERMLSCSLAGSTRPNLLRQNAGRNSVPPPTSTTARSTVGHILDYHNQARKP